MLRPNKEGNTDAIRDHMKAKGHQVAVQKFQEAAMDNMPRFFQGMQRQSDSEDNGLYKVTNRMFRTVYVELRSNIPFSSHPLIVSLQKTNGIDMGIHHYNHRTAKEMAMSLSHTMHETLVQYLMREDRPVSLIVDAATDNRYHHHLAMLFQPRPSGKNIV